MDALGMLHLVFNSNFGYSYGLGQSYQMIWDYVKAFNILIFIAFGVTAIGFFWYKKRKKARISNLPTD